MKNSNELTIIKQLEKARNQVILADGRYIRKSIAMLMDILSKTKHSNDRYDIYQYIILECSIVKDNDTHLIYAKKRYDEFKDLGSVMTYASALIDNNLFNEGLYYSEMALNMAKEDGSMINLAAVSYVRESLKTKDELLIDIAIRNLINSLEVYRKEDVKLELDWIDTAKVLGANSDLIAIIKNKRW